VTSSIVAFVLARYGEIVAAARAASNLGDAGTVLDWVSSEESGHAWRYGGQGIYEDAEYAGGAAVVALDVWPHIQPHIALHDPRYVLADIAAKRQIIEMHNIRREAGEFEGQPHVTVWCATCNEPGWCPTLRLLAAPFAQHPEFDPAWAVRTNE
jgi:hypothetical protein